MANEMKHLNVLELDFYYRGENYNFPENLQLPTVRELHVHCDVLTNQFLPLVTIAPNVEKLWIETDNGLDKTILSFPKLIELEGSIESLIKASSGWNFSRKQPRIKKIIAKDVAVCDKPRIRELYQAYREEFPNIKENFEYHE